MRISCPNCGAEYEVEADVIPEDGRDVQCSACGHTWMQFSDGRATEITGPGATTDDEPATSRSEPEPDPARDADTGRSVETADGPDEEADPQPRRRELDAETKRILQEEAAREVAQRRARRKAAEEAPIETQTDLGLTETEPSHTRSPTASPDDRKAAAAGLGVIAAEDRSGSRSTLLPDIEEINSTLDARPPHEAGETDSQTDAEIEDEPHSGKSGGFRSGFVLMIALALVLISLYLLAPRIAVAVPATEPLLMDYVEAMNDLRRSVDAALLQAAEVIGDLVGEVG